MTVDFRNKSEKNGVWLHCIL